MIATTNFACPPPVILIPPPPAPSPSRGWEREPGRSLHYAYFSERDNVTVAHKLYTSLGSARPLSQAYCSACVRTAIVRDCHWVLLSNTN